MPVNAGHLYVDFSSDGTPASWQNVASFSPYSGLSTSYANYVLDLDALASSQGIARDGDFYIRFRDQAYDGSGHDLYLDDVRITGSGAIRGSVWNDADGNGTQDAGEPGLQGATVFLDQNRNGRLDAGEVSTTTDANGEYTFASLPPGPYTVAQAAQAGWQPDLSYGRREHAPFQPQCRQCAAISTLVPNPYDFSYGSTFCRRPYL